MQGSRLLRLRALKALIHMRLPSYQRVLLIIFVVTLPLVNPWVRGDGVGYYAYVRALLVEHHLSFENDWRRANPSFFMDNADAEGHISPSSYTPTGRVNNRFAVGPSLLWAPFLIPVHGVMLTLQRVGFSVRADGFSGPYVVTMALATALYGFVGLWISFRLASLYVPERWTFLATLGVWFTSSLPVYMYFDPAYSHAHSVFAVAFFLWYWHRTRLQRTMAQWAILGLLSGLMLDIYYLNISILLVPFLESLRRYWLAWRAPGHDWEALRKLFLANTLYSCVTISAFLPTLITRQIIYGNPLELGYGGVRLSYSIHPDLWQPLFSSDHGLLTWTPIVIPAVVGLVLLRRYDRELATYCLAAVAALYYGVACHPACQALWRHGGSSFGNRYFLPLTPFFVLGLAVTLQEAARGLKHARTAYVTGALVIGGLILWNLAFIFQWGTGLVPHRGPISWKRMAYNQVEVVPGKLGGELKSYFTHRSEMMQRIEREDVQQLRRERGQVGD